MDSISPSSATGAPRRWSIPAPRIVWWCFPNFDGDPIFCRLVAGAEEKGFSDVVLDDMVDFQSEYLRNTAIVSTVLTDRHGGAVRITDFAPRFHQFGRVFRPPQLFRMIEPIAGLPRITVRVRPTHSYGQRSSRHSIGSNHIRYLDGDTVIRLTTDAPLSLIEHESPFVLTRPVHCVLGPDEPVTSGLATTSREFSDRTRDYWMDWVRGLSISYDYQEAVIRAAITLKLSNFEETGGVIAAHTTSIPESPGSGRTWDYRYCWLRDAYFVVKALNRIGATQTMEDFITFTLSIAANPDEALRPVYGIVPTDPAGGTHRPGPARLPRRRTGSDRQCGGGANPERHLWQHHPRRHADVLRSPPAAARRRGIVPPARAARQPRGEIGAAARCRDLGISRPPAHPHPFDGDVLGRLPSAGRDRVAPRVSRTAPATGTRSPIRCMPTLLERAWNEKRGAFTAAFGSDDLDASVLLLPDLGVIEAEDPRFKSTVAAMERELLRETHVMRYANADDFGLPVTAFLICRFWLVDAWWSLGRHEDARNLFVDALQHRNRYGLLSEDIDPQTGTMWGNFPQTYSMAGLILTAMRLSRSWEDRYWR